MVKNIKKGHDLIIFGAKGDLAKRKLIPSLYQLEKANKLNQDTRIIGVGRADWDKQYYKYIVRKALENFMTEKIEESLWNRLHNRLDFCNLDVNETKNFLKLKNLLDQKKRITINYFAVPPSIYGAICNGLASAKLNLPPARIVIEKPLGTSLKTSQEINNQIGKYFSESQIFRIDHYLGKETILNLLSLRFANPIFYKNWNNQTIDHIQITVAEEIGIEGRWDYFDKTGQMRDMVQNHLLQILSIIAMCPPNNLNADSIRDEKVKVLKSLRLIDETNIQKNTVRGQYTFGSINGIYVPAYINEEGAETNSNTETFVAIRVDIDNWRWSGVPFYLRTGKRLPQKYSEISIFFKNISMNLFKESMPILPQNKLIIRLQPNEGIDIHILNKIPELSSTNNLTNTKLSFNYVENFKKNCLIDAYERLLLESMRGVQSLFVRRDEVEEAWKWVDSIIHAWDQKQTQPELYQAGTWGPISSNKMIEKDKRNWNE
ncbi:Glucose-6-phosphate 1-dehydrogenase [Buchnera aphidicola (Eriosoma grossulariae)]|uniref:glucose-6-phosphate dehydrogenase n=1 Tax=Buchnera aphidicola TaxID=9 RepID=UPI00346430A0